jgi:hypothetical protein
VLPLPYTRSKWYRPFRLSRAITAKHRQRIFDHSLEGGDPFARRLARVDDAESQDSVQLITVAVAGRCSDDRTLLAGADRQDDARAAC